MLKGIFVATCCAVLNFVSQASAEILFNGTFIVTAVSHCSPRWQVGHNSLSQYHPRVPGNFNFTSLTLTFNQGAEGYSLRNGDFASTFKNVIGGGVGWEPFTWTGSQIRVISHSPALANINDNTKTVVLNGQIKKATGDPGAGNGVCVITFFAAYTRDQFN